MKIKKFAFSGTLGDSFIVLCKIYDFKKKNPNAKIEITRFTKSNLLFEKNIIFLYRLIKDVKINNSIKVQNENEIIEFISKNNLNYINTFWDGNKINSWEREITYLEMDPYPIFTYLNYNNKKNKSIKIGIQLNSGKKFGNFKGFQLSWVKEVIKNIKQYDPTIQIYIIGTGENYNIKKINKLKKFEVNVLVGQQTFEEWLLQICKFDFFISPEGFPTFFSMSQKVKTLVFYYDFDIISRVHPLWRDNNVFISVNFTNLYIRFKNYIYKAIYKRNSFLKPISAEQVVSIIHSKLYFNEK
tara:strand:+ start:3855 stop:4751 length:897 start_codon:yes stop_codon:yes gene_type:complete